MKKKNSVYITLVTLLIIIMGLTCMGAQCNNDQEIPKSDDPNESADSPKEDIRNEDEFNNITPLFSVANNQSLVEIDRSWSSIEENNSSSPDPAREFTQDEWKGDPAQVLREFYFTATVSGTVVGQAFHVEDLQAVLNGIMVVYRDGSIGGTGNITYTGGNDCIMDQDPSGTIICELTNLNNGTFNIDGEVVKSKDFGETTPEWPFNDYWLKVFFLSDKNPLEDIDVINTISGKTEPVQGYNLHQILYSGFFGQYQLFYPYEGVSAYKSLVSQYANGHANFEFIFDFGSDEVDKLRERMGLKVQ